MLGSTCSESWEESKESSKSEAFHLVGIRDFPTSKELTSPWLGGKESLTLIGKEAEVRTRKGEFLARSQSVSSRGT
jgi:hypothetical protein